MRSSLLSQTPGRRVATVGLAAVSITLAACGDATTAPTTALMTTQAGDAETANGLVVGGGGFPGIAAFLTIRVVDIYGKNLTEAMPIHFVSYPGPIAFANVKDNGTGDLDPTPGVIKLRRGRVWSPTGMA